MLLKISHKTRYKFDSPVQHGLQQLRKTPKSVRSQRVLNWSTTVQGGRKELQYEDQHRNTVELVGFDTGITELMLLNEGEVEMIDTQGIVGPHEGLTPLWLFQRTTPLTRPGKGVRDLARQAKGDTLLEQLHDLSRAIGEAVSYQVGTSEMSWSAEDVVEAGQGVCQDHTHVFLACARVLGTPARYVSGYLMMDDVVTQDAMHAWAEAHIDGLGWVGFDVSNGISPDARYVRVATGLDYSEAAPISGTRLGGAGETLDVTVEVSQQ